MTIWAPGVVLVGVVAAAHAWRSSRFEQSIDESAAQLTSILAAGLTQRTDLPPQIEAFAKRGAPVAVPGAVVLTQAGQMRLGADKAWSALTAEQTVSTIEPGFVWHARVEMAPFMTAAVVDSYVDGVGRLEARLFGSIRVALSDGPQTDRAELMRYLGELAWSPEAILYNRALSWRTLSAKEFEVSAISSGGKAAVRFTLNDEGDITQVDADDRPMGTGKQSTPMPWRAKVSDYGEVGEFRVPRRGEVSWLLPEGEFLYWRGEIISARRK